MYTYSSSVSRCKTPILNFPFRLSVFPPGGKKTQTKTQQMSGHLPCWGLTVISILAIFYPFSQFCKVDVSLPSL